MAFTGWYLQQGIRDQLGIGFFLIFFISTMLTIILLSQYSYFIFIGSLQIQTHYYESNEYDGVESAIAFLNHQLFLYEELSKLSIQVIRELINTFDTISPIHKLFTNLKPHTDCPNNNNCNFICYVENSVVLSDPLCKNFHENMLQLLPIIQTINSIELLWFGSNKIIRDISIYLNKCTTYYLNTKQDKAYYNQIEAEYNKSYENLITSFNSNSNVLLNAYYSTKGIDPNDMDTPKHQPYAHYTNSHLSSVYQHNKYGLTVVNGVMIDNFIEYLTLNTLKSFISYSILITQFNTTNEKETLISVSSCLYLLTIQTMGNSKSKELIDFSLSDLYDMITQIDKDNLTIDHCFLNNKTKEDMLEMTYTNGKIADENDLETFKVNKDINTYLMNNYHLKRKISLGTYRIKSSTSLEANYYEVIKSVYPDPHSLMIDQSSFLKYEQYYFYTLYPNFPSASRFLPTLYRSTNLTLFFVITLLIFWRIINIGMYFVMRKISSDITKPLNELKNAVESMTLNEDSKLEFRDDDEINDLFCICRDILQGALVIYKTNNDQKQIHSNNKDIDSNLIVNQNKIDENPTKTNILNCTSKLIMTCDQFKERKKGSNIERRSLQAEKDVLGDSNKKDFIHLAEIICNFQTKNDNILFNCYLKYKQEKMPHLVSTNTLITSPNSVVEQKDSHINLLRNSSLKGKKIEFREEENIIINMD